jgi:hypothetical protein
MSFRFSATTSGCFTACLIIIGRCIFLFPNGVISTISVNILGAVRAWGISTLRVFRIGGFNILEFLILDVRGIFGFLSIVGVGALEVPEVRVFALL